MPAPFTDASGNYLEGTNRPGLVSQPAATGSVIANAALLSKGFNLVSGVDGTKGVILPAGSPGDTIDVANPSGSTLKVYPPVNGTINNGSANASVNVLTVKMATFRCVASGNWWQVISG